MMGWFSVTSKGLTRAFRMILALPPSTTRSGCSSPGVSPCSGGASSARSRDRSLRPGTPPCAGTTRLFVCVSEVRLGKSSLISCDILIAHVPPNREAVGDDAHQFSLATDALIEHDQLQAEEHFGVDAGTARGGVEMLHQVSHEGELELLLKTAVKIVLLHEIFERDVLGEWLEVALLRTHHSGASCRERPMLAAPRLLLQRSNAPTACCDEA